MALPSASSLPHLGATNPLLEDDEEVMLKDVPASSLKVYTTTNDPILALIEKNYAQLHEQYSSGWRAFQFITAEVLMQAPKDWFDRYDKDLKAATGWTQTQLAARDRAEPIAAAQADPTNNALQDNAFRAVYATLAEWLDTAGYRGTDRLIMISMVSSEIIGLSRIDPLWRDRTVDEIIVNGPRDVQVEIKGKLHRVPGCNFRDSQHLMNMLEKIYGSIGKTLSPTEPQILGRLHDNSRIHAQHTAIAPKGPNVAIRRHPDRFWTPSDLIAYGSMDEKVAEFLGNLIYRGCSFIVIGGTSTGKTSFLNAMTGFYRDDVRLLTLEKNLEMKPNPGKMLAAALETKPGNKETNVPGVTMRDLVEGSLQMRPDGIIIGEVTNGAAFDLAQALNTGHFGASTVHANSEFDGIYRLASLIQQGANLSQSQTLPLIAAAFDFIVFLEHFPLDGSRRLSSIAEVNPYAETKPGEDPKLGVRQLFKFVDDGVVSELDENNVPQLKITGHWEQTGEISDVRRQRRHLDLVPPLSWEELKELSTIPEWALKEQKEEAETF